MHKPLLAGLTALALTACAGARLEPEVPVGESYSQAPATGTIVAAEIEFWRDFDDPVLTALVEDTFAANHDLRIAAARLERAQALSRQSGLDRLPVVTATGAAAETRASADQLPGVPRDLRDADSHEVAAALSWELDLFGRVRGGARSERAEARATAADRTAAQVAVVADLAGTYVSLRGLQGQLEVARNNARIQRESLDIVAARFDAGRGTELDIARAQSQLESTLARIPAFEAETVAAMHRLAVLTGKAPGALDAMLAEAPRWPALPERVAAGSPGELLRRRPDVAAAEFRLSAAAARIGVATADLFPRFTLGGLIGSQAADRGDLFERDSETRLVALGVDWTFLDFNRVRARIAAAEAGGEEQLARYEQTVLRAIEETENALVRHMRSRQELAHLERAAATGSEAARLARVRYEVGVTDFLQVLDAERTRLVAESQLIDGRTRNALALVTVYRALAGGWTR